MWWKLGEANEAAEQQISPHSVLAAAKERSLSPKGCPA
jgi:hypothetical protein